MRERLRRHPEPPTPPGRPRQEDTNLDSNGPTRLEERHKSRRTARSLFATVAVLALALAASCGGQSGSGGGGQPAGQTTGGGGGEAPAAEQAVGHPALGDANAPVVLTEYGDYQ